MFFQQFPKVPEVRPDISGASLLGTLPTKDLKRKVTWNQRARHHDDDHKFNLYLVIHSGIHKQIPKLLSPPVSPVSTCQNGDDDDDGDGDDDDDDGDCDDGDGDGDDYGDDDDGGGDGDDDDDDDD